MSSGKVNDGKRTYTNLTWDARSAHGVDVLFELDHVSFGGEKREIGGRELRPSENGTVLHLL